MSIRKIHNIKKFVEIVKNCDVYVGVDVQKIHIHLHCCVQKKWLCWYFLPQIQIQILLMS